MVCCACSEFRIRSPNLKNLYLCGELVKICLYAPHLTKMHVRRYEFLTKTVTLGWNYTDLLGCLTNLVELSGYNFVKYLSVGIESCHHTLVFHHLTVIQLLDVDLADTKQQSVVACLIIGAPNLHKLKIIARDIEYGSDTPYVPFEDFGYEPNFTFEKLKEVILYGVCDCRFEMHLIKLLLESSPVLETVNLNLTSPKAAFELLGFRRSSTNARILASAK